jgi:tetratricopeptide (TPR) repeat protein
MEAQHPSLSSETFANSGDLRETAFAELLVALLEAQVTGTLQVADQHGELHASIRFEDGLPVAARVPYPEATLMQSLIPLCARSEGSYVFAEDRALPPTPDVITGEVDPLALIAAAMRGPVREDVINRALALLGSSPLKLNPRIDLERYCFTPQEHVVIAMLWQAPIDVLQLQGQTDVAPHFLRRLVYVLAITRAITVLPPAHRATSGTIAHAPPLPGPSPEPRMRHEPATDVVPIDGLFTAPPNAPVRAMRAATLLEHPARPARSAEPAQPARSGEISRPVRNAEPTQSVRNAEPAQSARSAEPSQPVRSAEPAQPAPNAEPSQRLRPAADGTRARKSRLLQREATGNQREAARYHVRNPALGRTELPAAAIELGLPRDLPPVLQLWCGEILERARLIAHQNHYEMLGIERDCRDEQIDAALSALIKHFDPAQLPEELASIRDHAQAIIDQATQAAETLRDPERRRRYHRDLEAGNNLGVRPAVQRGLQAEAHFRKSEGLLKRKEYAGALHEAERALTVGGACARYEALYGYLLYLRGSSSGGPIDPRAIEHLARAIKRDSRCVHGHYYMALMLKQDGKAEQAHEHFSRVLKLQPGHLEAAREIRLFELRRAERRPSGRFLDRLLGRTPAKDSRPQKRRPSQPISDDDDEEI